MVAMVAILDPPREEAIDAIHVAHSAGITVKMITGAGCKQPVFRALPAGGGVSLPVWVSQNAIDQRSVCKL
jgi:hypothetical protein